MQKTKKQSRTFVRRALAGALLTAGLILALALFACNNEEKNDTETSGVKTLTVVGGTGKEPAGNGTNNGSDNYDGTRHITVTVTMSKGAITDVTIGHPIEIPEFENASFKTDANALADAIKTKKNANAAFTPTGKYTGDAAKAWTKHEAAIRKAVKDASAALKKGKPNRTVAGGGANTPWTVGGKLLAGKATVTGSGYKSGGAVPSSSSLPTDMTVTVEVKQGLITAVTVDGEGDDVMHTDYNTEENNAATISDSLTDFWPAAMTDANTYKAVDTITGASPNAKPFKYVSLMTMRKLTEMAFNKIVNEY